jgi:predicted secreted protein
MANGNILQTSDGGYIFSGYTGSFGAGGLDGAIIKTDSIGNIKLNQTYGGALDESFADLINSKDRNYVLCGYTMSFGAGSHDFWLLKVNASGSILLNQTYGGIGSDQAYSLIQTIDGGYALAGSTNSSGAGNLDYWLVKTDATGTILWNKTYGGTGADIAMAVVQSSDGGYAIAGRSAPLGSSINDFWLLKTDSTGNVVWNKTYGGTANDQPNSMVLTIDGGYAMFGATTSFGAGGSDAWLVKTDSNGNIQWNKTYGGSGTESALYVVQTSEGGYALTGSTPVLAVGGVDIYLIKTDESGNQLWNKTYGGPANEDAYSLIQTIDGGYAIAGQTRSFGYGNSANFDWYLIKADSECGLTQISSTVNSITLCRGATDAYWNYVRVRIWKTT